MAPQPPIARTRPGFPGARLGFQFATVTTRTAEPVPPAESRTLIVTEWLPFGVPLVVHGIETGPLEVVLVGGRTAVPSTLIVKVMLPAARFSSKILNSVSSLTVRPTAHSVVVDTVYGSSS